jgi:amino acid transporter
MGVEETKKGLDVEATSAAPPAYVQDGHIQSYEEEDFWTRNGLTLKSFQRRPSHVVELNRSMKTRHMHMIAIGGSIGTLYA